MARSTGPALAIGAVTLFNDVIIHQRTLQEDTRVVVGTALAAIGFAVLEKVQPELAVGLAWTALAAVCLTRINPSVPSPVESFLGWYNAK